MLSELPSHLQVQFMSLLSLGKPGAARALYERFRSQQARKRHQELKGAWQEKISLKQALLARSLKFAS